MALLNELSYSFLSALHSINTSIILAFLTTSIFICYWYLSIPKNLPPGPIGLPIIGYIPFAGREPYVTFKNLTTKYGPIVSLYLGNRLVIVLNTYDAIKEAFVRKGDTFSGRPPMHSTADEESYSIPLADGEAWKIHRKFASNLLRDLGVGKLSIEPLITGEIQHFLAELKKYDGKPTDFAHLLSSSVADNICIMIFGKRFQYDDPWFIKSNQLMIDLAASANAMSILHFFPWLTKLPGIEKLVNQQNLRQNLNEFKTYVNEQIRVRKMNEMEGQRDNYMNAFIGEQRARMNTDKNDNVFPDIALEQNVRDLMLAGTETVSNTLLWCILCMVRNPEMQSEVQKEIDEIIGKDRTPCWNDRLRTPYTEAVILEAQRIATLVPLSIPHRNTKECELFGYTIPQGTTILANLWAVHNDTNLWNDPDVFRPERFLSPNGEVDKKEYLIPYSLGKRECLGISLAKMELYLYFTSMLQRFTFKSPDDSKPSLKVKLGVTAAPKYFFVKPVKRNVQ